MSDLKSWIEQKGPRLFFIIISLEVLLLAMLATTDLVTSINYDQNVDSSESELWKKNQLYKWTILFVFVISQYYYAWNAVKNYQFNLLLIQILRANVLELFAFIIISTATYGASFIRFYKLSPIKVIQIFNYIYLIYAACVLVLSYICYKPFYDIFIYRNVMKVGASLQYQKMYTNYSNFNALIKLYFQISLCTFVSFFFYFDDGKWIDIGIDLGMIVLLLIGIYFGYRGLNLENRNYLFVYAIFISIIQLYVLSKMFLLMAGYNFSLKALGVDLYTKLIILATSTSCLGIMLMNFYYVFRCEQEFGKGLKEALLHSRTQSIDV